MRELQSLPLVNQISSMIKTENVLCAYLEVDTCTHGTP